MFVNRLDHFAVCGRHHWLAGCYGTGACRLASIVAVGAIASLVLSAKVAAVEQERANWGRTTTVAVVIEPVALGQRVADSVELRELPLAVVPVGAATTVAITSLAKVPLYVGEVLAAVAGHQSARDRAAGWHRRVDIVGGGSRSFHRGRGSRRSLGCRQRQLLESFGCGTRCGARVLGP